MRKDVKHGNYFRRGRKKIEFEKEEEFFTAIARDQAKLERVRSLPGVSEMKMVKNRIFKVYVSKDKRDAAIDRFPL